MSGPYFSRSELSIIRCALAVAAAVYDRDASTARRAGEFQVAEQFERRAKSARDLAYNKLAGLSLGQETYGGFDV